MCQSVFSAKRQGDAQSHTQQAYEFTCFDHSLRCIDWYDNILLKYQICNKNLMRRRLSYKELELENQILQDTLASTEKDLAHYKERVRVLEAYISRTTKEIRNLTHDFQIIRNYVNELNEKLEEKQGKIAVITTRLKYYENAHSPYEFTSSGILCANHINCRDQLCVNLDTGELILFVFLEYDSVEPTNNPAEQWNRF